MALTTEQEVLGNFIEALINHISENRSMIEDDKALSKTSELISSLMDCKDELESTGINISTNIVKKINKDWEKIYQKHC
mgnify:CR=1 FL=1